MYKGTHTRCIICDRVCSDRNWLTNGYTYHRHCYSDLLNRITEVDRRISSVRVEIANAKSEIRRAGTVLYAISSFFTGHKIDLSALGKELLILDQRLEQLESRRHALNTRLTEMYDYWHHYPPDWNNRKSKALSETRKCANFRCRSIFRKLQVHHITPFSVGGDHTPANLMVLCEKCHAEVHGRKEFSSLPLDVAYDPRNRTKEPVRLLPPPKYHRKTPHKQHFQLHRDVRRERRLEQFYPLPASLSQLSGSGHPHSSLSRVVKSAESPTSHKAVSLIERRVEHARNAIEQGQFLHFEYTKPNGSRSTRTINPRTIKMVESSLCVSGYCYLRKDLRTFAFKRMRRVAVVKEIGNCFEF